MKSLFEQIGTMLNFLTTVLNKFKEWLLSLQLSLRNANRLTQHIEELKKIISIHNIDVMLISKWRQLEITVTKT
jgi:hypothetical protein